MLVSRFSRSEIFASESVMLLRRFTKPSLSSDLSYRMSKFSYVGCSLPSPLFAAWLVVFGTKLHIIPVITSDTKIARNNLDLNLICIRPPVCNKCPKVKDKNRPKDRNSRLRGGEMRASYSNRRY